MASLMLQPRAAASSLGRDLDPRGALPYARHVTGEIIGLDTQALMMTFQLDGASFETADVRDLNRNMGPESLGAVVDRIVDDLQGG